jgi:dienelactone hydrolase
MTPMDRHENTKTRKPILFRTFVISWLISSPAIAQPVKPALPEGVTTKDVKFFSEAVQCYAKIYLPKSFTAEGRTPAVVLAPAPGATAASVDKYAAQLAARGLVAMAIDYRGWGKSGGFLYLSEPVHWDDRLRFSQHTAKVRIRRKRLIPDAQILDIRNAISYLQGESGVDRARLGLWGADLAGGHVVTTAATDSRVKAAVAQTPIIHGKDVARRAIAPSAEQQAEMVRLARTGQAPATVAAAEAMNDHEAKLALAEYHPFWYVDQIPQATAVLFVVAEKDLKVNNDANAVAASKVLRGPNGVTVVPGATHAMSTADAFDAAVEAAAAWFQKYL